MKVKESKNLVCDRFPLIRRYEGYNHVEPNKCLLERFDEIDDRIELDFKNGKEATIRAKNIQGEQELDLIADKLKDFIGMTYEEILNMNI